MSNKASRLITLIMLLQRRPHQKVAELARELGVSMRSLHRYLAMLDEMGIPVYAERGPAGGISLVRGFRMPPLVFTPDEAVAISLGTNLVREMWGTLYGGSARDALAKLENVLPEEQRQEVAWARRALVATGLNVSDVNGLASNLEVLRQAAREQREVEMAYRSERQEVPLTRRTLDPYGMVYRWGWWYVIGWCHTREAVRTFRVDRIQELQPRTDTFQLPAEFDIHAYLAREFTEQPQIQVRLRFCAAAAHLVAEFSSYWECVTPQSDGSIEVALSTPELNWVINMALTFGPGAEILSPPELRQRFYQHVIAIAKNYSPTEG